MKILITGANGFIGKNLVAELKNQNHMELMEYDKDTDPTLLDIYCKEANFVYHLAGVNRSEDKKEFIEGNFEFSATILDTLKKYNNACPILITSSIQADFDNEYGKSKKAEENLLIHYAKEVGAKVLIYRLPNVFGKWSRPNYNSAVATFCHNIAHNLPITVNNPSTIMKLVYIDDVVEAFIHALIRDENSSGNFYEVPILYTITLGEIVNTIDCFQGSRAQRTIPNMSDAFTKKLYSTYLSYLPKDNFNYELKMNIDVRGSFTEFIKTSDRGQISVNISKPGIIKGNHWHNTKIEKFLVVSGRGVIRLRNITSAEVIEYYVNGDKMEVVDIPVGFTHNIENLGDTDLVTIMWVNESYNPDKSDTYYLEV